MSDKDDVADALERFKLAHEAEDLNRIAALEDLRFARLGEQWPQELLKERELEGRPALTINKLPTIIRQVVNDARQNKPSIKARPVDSFADPKTADIINGVIRNIESQSNADVSYDTAIDFAASMGFGYFRIKTDYAHDDTFDLDLMIERVANPFTIYGDPYSQSADASDWRFAFVTELIPHEEFKRRYKGADEIDWDSTRDSKLLLWYSDKSVRVAEYWEREEVKRPIVQLSSGLVLEASRYEANRALFDAQGLAVTGTRDALSWEVTQRVMNAAQVLEANKWAGKLIPICPVYGEEVNVEGVRYFRGLVRDAKDPQRIFNYWRTTTTEMVALQKTAPWIGVEGSFVDPNWGTAHTKNHPYLEYKGGVMPQRQPFAGIPAGALQEAMNAADDIKAVTGIYDASLGARSNETSGKAIMARQREGDVSTFHFIDNLSRAIRYAGRVLIDMIPSVYSSQRMVRILGEDGKEDLIEVNNGVIDLTRGKYDLVVQAGPSFTTRREEAATQMVELTRANPTIAPIIMDKLAKNLDWPEADTLSKRFQAMLPPAIQQLESQGEQDPQAMAQKVAQLQQALQQAQQMLQQATEALHSKQAEVQGKVRTAEIDAEVAKFVAAKKAEVDKAVAEYQAQLKAETERYIAGIKSQASVQIAHEQAEFKSGAPPDDAANDSPQQGPQGPF